MQSFSSLASQAQQALEAEYKTLETKKGQLQEKMNVLAQHELAITEKEQELERKDKDLVSRLEEVSRREANLHSQDEVEQAKAEAERLSKQALDAFKKAKELNDDASLKLKDLSKRELALSEEKKSYEARIKQEMIDRMFSR
jgi:hypothetical protein